MRLLVALVFALALAVATGTTRSAWGVGGVHDSVRRAALRFSLGALPADAVVVTAAELALSYDGTCVAPRRATRPCDGRGFELDAHPIFTPRCLAEREVEFRPVVAVAALDPFAPAGPLVWDVTTGAAPRFRARPTRTRRCDRS